MSAKMDGPMFLADVGVLRKVQCHQLPAVTTG